MACGLQRALSCRWAPFCGLVAAAALFAVGAASLLPDHVDRSGTDARAVNPALPAPKSEQKDEDGQRWSEDREPRVGGRRDRPANVRPTTHESSGDDLPVQVRRRNTSGYEASGTAGPRPTRSAPPGIEPDDGFEDEATEGASPKNARTGGQAGAGATSGFEAKPPDERVSNLSRPRTDRPGPKALLPVARGGDSGGKIGTQRRAVTATGRNALAAPLRPIRTGKIGANGRTCASTAVKRPKVARYPPNIPSCA